MKKTFRYNVILRPEPEGGFTVVVPSLPGCVTYGRNLKEAGVNRKELETAMKKEVKISWEHIGYKWLPYKESFFNDVNLR